MTWRHCKRFLTWSCFLLWSLGTGLSFMSISSLVLELWQSFYKGLTRNPEIGSITVWILPNILRLGQVMDTIFGVNVSNRILLNTAKFQGYSFYRFWVIKGKPTEGEENYSPPSTPRLGLIIGSSGSLNIQTICMMITKISMNTIPINKIKY